MIEDIKKRLADLNQQIDDDYVAGNDSNMIYRVRDLGILFEEYLKLMHSKTLTQRISEAFDSRLKKVLEDKTPKIPQGTARIVLQMSPVSAFEQVQGYDVGKLANSDLMGNAKPIYAGGWDCQHNFDGVISFNRTDNGMIPSYTQYYRDGVIEGVDAQILNYQANEIPNVAFEKNLIEFVKRNLDIYSKLGVQPPIVIQLDLVGVKDYKMLVPQGTWNFDAHEIREENLRPQHIIIDDLNVDVDVALKPIFDQVWNACGFSGSINYRGGHWNPQVI